MSYNTLLVLTIFSAVLCAADTPDKRHATALAFNISKNEILLQWGSDGKTLLEELSPYKRAYPLTYNVAQAGTVAKEATLQMLAIDNAVQTAENMEERARLREQYQAACIIIAQNLPITKIRETK